MKKDFIAVLAETNTSGVGIVKIDDYGETVSVVDIYGDSQSKVCTCQLKSNSKGNIYFNHRRVRYYLNDFIRTNISN